MDASLLPPCYPFLRPALLVSVMVSGEDLMVRVGEVAESATVVAEAALVVAEYVTVITEHQSGHSSVA